MWYYILLVAVVVASGGAVLWIDPKKITGVKLLLSFSGAYLFGLIFLHLLPEIYSDSIPQIGLLILVGFLLQLALDYFSKGIEHGHSHYHGQKFPIAIFLGLCVHSFFEGMPIIKYTIDGSMLVNYSLISGIMIHKIPIAIVLATLLKNIVSPIKAILILLVFALTLPAGSAANLFIEQYMEEIEHYHHIVLALVIGIMLHVSTTILYESDDAHKFNLAKIASVVLGFAIAYFT